MDFCADPLKLRFAEHLLPYDTVFECRGATCLEIAFVGHVLSVFDSALYVVLRLMLSAGVEL